MQAESGHPKVGTMNKKRIVPTIDKQQQSFPCLVGNSRGKQIRQWKLYSFLSDDGVRFPSSVQVYKKGSLFRGFEDMSRIAQFVYQISNLLIH